MTAPARRPWWRDPRFAALCVAGPIVWAGLAVAFVPTPDTLPAPGLLLRTVLVAPVLEELVFRGLLQGALLERATLARRVAGISGANALTSLAFVAAHLWSQPPLAAAAVLVPSLAFGWCRDRYGAVVPGTVLHAWYNAGFIWLYGPA